MIHNTSTHQPVNSSKHFVIPLKIANFVGLVRLTFLGMKKIELEIVAISHTATQSSNYALVLGETEGVRRLPIVIGGFEAQAIAVAMERMSPPRPLTHDLMCSTLETFGIELQEVIISNLLDGIFYARLVCTQNGEVVEIDSRTSDALALAVRVGCPIYSYEFILEAAGVVLETPEIEEEDGRVEVRSARKEPALSQLNVDELKSRLENALSEENYEFAAMIRDEISRKGG